jgi:hypothetical protein
VLGLFWAPRVVTSGGLRLQKKNYKKAHLGGENTLKYVAEVCAVVACYWTNHVVTYGAQLKRWVDTNPEGEAASGDAAADDTPPPPPMSFGCITTPRQPSTDSLGGKEDSGLRYVASPSS